jgi:hypothetical protein
MSKDAKLARRRALRYSSVNDRTRSTTKYVIVTDHYYCCTPPARGCRHDDGCSRCDIKFYEHIVDRDLELGILPQTEYHVPLAGGVSSRFLKAFAEPFVSQRARTSRPYTALMFHGNLVKASASSRRSSLWKSWRAAILLCVLQALSALIWLSNRT